MNTFPALSFVDNSFSIQIDDILSCDFKLISLKPENKLIINKHKSHQLILIAINNIATICLNTSKKELKFPAIENICLICGESITDISIKNNNQNILKILSISICKSTFYNINQSQFVLPKFENDYQLLPATPLIKDELMLLYQTFKSKHYFKKQLLKLRINSFVYLFYDEHKIKQQTDELSNEMHLKIEHAAQLITENIAYNYSIKELAQAINSNTTYLKNNFKKKFGVTIKAFQLKLRMQRAKELLMKNQQYNIDEIAFEVGYKHASHFSIAFKNYFGYSPKSFKNKNY